MNIIKQKNNELIKHTSAIHVSNVISVVERKISNILLKNSFSELSNKDKHCIQIKDIIRLLGWESNNNYELIKSSIKVLNTTQIEWNILRKDKKNEWGVATIISGAKIKNGICEYSYSPILKELLAIPNIYAKLNMAVQAKFNSKHSLALWEFFVEILCSYNSNIVSTNCIPILDIRKILGIDKVDIYDEFKILNRDVLKKAINEINKISDIEVECIHKKEGKKIIALIFNISRKVDFEHPLLDLANPSALEEHSFSNDEILDDGEKNLQYKLQNEFGMSSKTAQEILQTYSNNKIEQTIHYVLEQCSNSKIKNLTAYFISALKENWAMGTKKLLNDGEGVLIEVENHIASQTTIWKDILLYLKNVHGDVICHTWFIKLEFVDYDEKENLLRLKAETTFYRDWIDSNYNKDILIASKVTFPKIKEVIVL